MSTSLAILKINGVEITVAEGTTILKAARDNGISGFTAYTSMQNRAMAKLFNTLPYKVRTAFEDGMLVMGCQFDDPDSGKQTETR